MDMREIEELQAWYLAQCDGEWEHQFGVRIETLDNPGWIAAIDLARTDLEERPFSEVKRGSEHETNWIRCWREEKQFKIACGPLQLADSLQVFLSWSRAI